MDNWFSKATNVFRRETEEQAQPFQTVCECGQEHVGVRRARHQHIVCKSCGVSLFVLPRDVYPPPRESKRNALTATPQLVDVEPPEADDYVDVDDIEIIEPDRAPSAARTRTRPTIAERPPGMEHVERELPPSSFERRRKPKPEKPERSAKPKAPVVPKEPRIPLSVRFRTFLQATFTPLRLVAFGFVTLFAMLGFFLVQQQSQRSALRIIQTEVDAGRAAANEEDWIAARDHLQAAVIAFDTLKRTDLESQSVRQLHRETQALTRLSTGSLLDLVEEGEEYLKTHDPELLPEYLLGRHGLDWYVVEGPVRIRTRHPKEPRSGEPLFELILPWVTESGRAIRVEADFPCFREVVTGTKTAPALFGAQLADCRLKDDVWTIRLIPESGFLWCNRHTYDALRLPPDPDRPLDKVEIFLKSQANAMGVTE